MKFSLTFKTPDVLEQALDNIKNKYSSDCDHCGDCIGCEAMEDSFREDRELIECFTDRFIKYGESITIDFDTTEGTAIVKKVK